MVDLYCKSKQHYNKLAQNQYTRTYFGSINGELGKICDIRKFLYVADISGKVEKKMMSPEDKVALKMVEKKHKHDGQPYKVAIPWIKHLGSCFLNNYCDAEKKITSYREATLKETRSVQSL